MTSDSPFVSRVGQETFNKQIMLINYIPKHSPDHADSEHLLHEGMTEREPRSLITNNFLQRHSTLYISADNHDRTDYAFHLVKSHAGAVLYIVELRSG